MANCWPAGVGPAATSGPACATGEAAPAPAPAPAPQATLKSPAPSTPKNGLKRARLGFTFGPDMSLTFLIGRTPVAVRATPAEQELRLAPGACAGTCLACSSDL